MKKLLLLAMFLCPLAAAAEPIFQSLQLCKPGDSAARHCSVVLYSDGYLVDVDSGKKLSDTPESMGTLNSYELYRDGGLYILASENFSRAKTRRWVVFGYEDGRVILKRVYIFSLDASEQSGPYWHGYECRPDSKAFTRPTDESFSESAMQALCGDVEGDVVLVQEDSPVPVPAKSLAVSVPVYNARNRHGAVTYVFVGSEEPDLSTMGCQANCSSITPEKSKYQAGSVSAASANAKETCNLDSFANPDLITCGQQSLEKLDAVLNEQYKKALASLASEDKKQLIDVQRKWVRFKESYCEELYRETFPGAEAPIEKLLCLRYTTNTRLGELIYLQTGLTNDGFYRAASLMAGQDRDKGLQGSINRLGGDDFADPVWKQYADGHCDMSFRLFREDLAYCVVRMRFQLPMNR